MKRITRTIAISICYAVTACLSINAWAQPLPSAAPESVGLAATPGAKGDYTWNGANGTLFWADPQERLVVVVGTAAPGEIRKYYREQMGALVYGAMTALRR